MTDIVVVGHGAVGITVAVALSSSSRKVILAGPRGTPERRQLFTAGGYINRSVEILHTAIDRVSHRAVVVSALKAFSIRNAASDVKRISNGKIICLSNGMNLEEEWGDLAGEVEYGVLSMGFRKTGQSSVSTTRGFIYGSACGVIAGLFRNSDIPFQEVAEINDFRWAKWYANSIINPIAALAVLENNKLIDAGLLPLITGLSLEVSRLMPTGESRVAGEDMLTWLLENSSNRCSMLQDVEKGVPTEIDFLTALCEKRLPGQCPRASVLTSLVKARTVSGT
ncbi:MAG: ketopantoate reductase C-terminal domain-containing protein [Candidatus Fermentibacteria bacterium]|nr:ketopantoate reductase C-terminal domain-containing protein [Candidatus Fermentibacteria bacterium]